MPTAVNTKCWEYKLYHICSQLTLLHDLELKELTKGVIVPEGGVKENNIHKVIIILKMRNHLQNYNHKLPEFLTQDLSILKELLPKNSASANASEEDRHQDSEI